MKKSLNTKMNKERLQEYPLHESQRGYFGYELYKAMEKDERIWLVVVDLGYKMFDRHFLDFPDRCINTGAAEQAAVGIAVGLALQGKVPFVYSITTFAIFRPYEWIRNYMAIEQVPVKIVGSGRDMEYEKDGLTHWSSDAPAIMSNWTGKIVQFWPKTKEAMADVVKQTIENNKPTFISLSRKI